MIRPGRFRFTRLIRWLMAGLVAEVAADVSTRVEAATFR